jgi:3-mercaptopyruvate sulfurtransferase SseA
VRLASDPSGVISDAQQACADIIQRMRTTGTRAARSGELAALWDLEAAMIDILATVTHAERFRAEERIRARTAAALAGKIPGAIVVEYRETA